jgi:hypothetical protein
MIVIYIINIINCLICFSISIIFYNKVKNKINNNNNVIDYLKNELVKSNNNFIELTNERYKNTFLYNKLKCQSKKLDDEIEKNNKYYNIITNFKRDIKKQSLFKNKSEILKERSKKQVRRKYYSCNDLNIIKYIL